jgi:hypothetical protein
MILASVSSGRPSAVRIVPHRLRVCVGSTSPDANVACLSADRLRAIAESDSTATFAIAAK